MRCPDCLIDLDELAVLANIDQIERTVRAENSHVYFSSSLLSVSSPGGLSPSGTSHMMAALPPCPATMPFPTYLLYETELM